MTAPLTDEPTVQQILDKLVGEACHLDEPDYSTAITNATEQIRQQERERVEKLRKALDDMLDWALSNRGTEHEFVTCYTYGHGKKPEVILSAEAALKELEAE